MMTHTNKIESNVANGYTKTYATVANAKTQIAKAEKRLDTTLNAMVIALDNGRFTVAIHGRNPNDFMTALHGTKGWFNFN